jgi:hypothetical protein
LGTALVYPTFAAIAQTTNPHQELKALVHSGFGGSLGYAISAIISNNSRFV